MPELTMTKHHGLGNDFLVLLADDRPEALEALARAVCDRRRGVGADGLIFATAGGPGDADVEMELRNADGSAAEMSGNGIRCLAQAVVDAGMVPGPQVSVRTDAGIRRVTVEPEMEPGLRQVTVEMGRPVVAVCEPGRAEVDMGNPHLVVLARGPGDVDVAELGRLHPDVNVEVVSAGPEPDSLVMQVHERGVGLTEACGTGSCAAAAAARLWGMVGDRVLVHNPGGDVTVELRADTVMLTGPTRYVARVQVPVVPAAAGAPTGEVEPAWR